MPNTPDPTIYLKLHKTRDEISTYSKNADGTYGPLVQPLPVGSPGKIYVVFMNDEGNDVETGNITFTMPANSSSPFNTLNGNAVVGNDDNGKGVGKNPINGLPAPIKGNLQDGAKFSFSICGSWDNGHHQVGQDPTIVIKNN